MKIVGKNVSLKETRNKLPVGPMNLLFRMVWKKRDSLSPLFSTLLLNTPCGRSKETKRVYSWMGHISVWSVLRMLIYWAKT
jgi:hypothetical protein